MGYLTTVVLRNDAMHEFEKHPLEFAQAICEGVRKASRSRQKESVDFFGYGNYIEVHPPRHADDRTLYLHYGNGVDNLCPYTGDFKSLIEEKPQLAKEFLAVAESVIKDMKRVMKLNKKKEKK